MRGAAFALATLVVAAPARGDPARPFLGALRVENPGHLSAFAVRARVVISAAATPKAAELRERFPSAREDGGAIVVLAQRYAPSHAAPVPADLAASFLLDFDEPVFAPLRKVVAERYGEQPTPAQLERFAAAYITRKDLARGLDVASQVATRREGDCKEHAVLLAALARLFGIPARVVTGLILLQDGNVTIAAGHAWTEIHAAGAWGPFDATDLPASALRIPLATVRDEGPGFTFGIMQSLHPLDVVAVSLEPVDAEPAVVDGSPGRSPQHQ